jgi:hypothetical protein
LDERLLTLRSVIKTIAITDNRKIGGIATAWVSGLLINNGFGVLSEMQQLLICLLQSLAKVRFRLIHDSADIDDVMQKVFVRTYRAFSVVSWWKCIYINGCTKFSSMLPSVSFTQRKDGENFETAAQCQDLNPLDTKLLYKNRFSSVNAAVGGGIAGRSTDRNLAQRDRWLTLLCHLQGNDFFNSQPIIAISMLALSMSEKITLERPAG